MNLLSRFVTALAAVGILALTLELSALNGAIVLISILASLISVEIVRMFSHNLLRALYVIGLTLTGLATYYFSGNLILSLLPHFAGIILIPWIQRTNAADISYQNLLTQLLVLLYGFLLPVMIYEILKADPDFVLFYFFGLLVFGVDTFAFFFGKFFGRKFIKSSFQPVISPSKTYEGFLGSLLWPLILCFGFSQLNLLQFNVLSLALIYLCVFAAISGDLIASLIKRKSKKKDTGKLLPGHGGVLDRLDSLLMSAPFFLFALKYIHLL